MSKLENVVKALKCCPNGFCIPHCPYSGIGAEGDTNACKLQLFEDAADLLATQEKQIELQYTTIEKLALYIKGNAPRLMTLDEVNAMDWDCCYLEEEMMNDVALHQMFGKHHIRCITWPTITSCKLTYGEDAYNKRWRCWDKKPSESDREAAKWDI